MRHARAPETCRTGRLTTSCGVPHPPYEMPRRSHSTQTHVGRPASAAERPTLPESFPRLCEFGQWRSTTNVQLAEAGLMAPAEAFVVRSLNAPAVTV